MKWLMLIGAVMVMSLSASAQFTTFEPVIVDRNGNRVQMNSGNNSYNNYYNMNPYNYGTPQRQQQQPTQVISTRGYYIKNNQWNSVLIRVKVVGEDVYVVGIKRQATGWSNSSSKASSTQFMQQEIRDNFDYYVGDYVYGNIYF